MVKEHQRSVTFTMTRAEYQRAETVADREDRSVSSLIRLALSDYCDRAEGQAPATTEKTTTQGAGPWPRNPFDRIA